MVAISSDDIRVQYSDFQSRWVADTYCEGGGVGWVLPAGSRSYKSEEYATTLTSTEAYTVIDTTGTNGVAYSEMMVPEYGNTRAVAFRINVGRITGSPNVTIEVQLYDHSGALITSNVTRTNGTVTATAAGWTTLGQHADSGVGGSVGAARLKVTGIGVYAIQDMNILTDTWGDGGSSFVSGLATPINRYWNTLANVYNIKIQRGCRRYPPLDQLEIGTMSLRAKAPLYASMQPGYLSSMRMQHKNSAGQWVTVFQGRVEKETRVSMPKAKDDYLEMVVVDKVALMARSRAFEVEDGNVRQRMESVLAQAKRDNRVQQNWIDNWQGMRVQGPALAAWAGKITGTNPAILTRGSTVRVKADVDVLDQMLTVRNTDMGYLWVDRYNQIQYAPGNGGYVAGPPMTMTAPESQNRTALVFRDIAPQAGERTPLFAGMDLDNLSESAVNEVTMVTVGVGTTSGEPYEISLGPYSNRWNQARRAGSVNYINTAPTGTAIPGKAKELARVWLSKFREHWMSADRFSYNFSKEPEVAAKLDIYDPIIVHRARATSRGGVMPDTNFRIIGLTHDISPGRWITTFDVRPRENLETPFDNINISGPSDTLGTPTVPA